MAAALLPASCDIADDDRFVELPQVKINRSVLLMDFTGQKCVNCPEAHEIMADLVKQYGDTALITVSIHGGGMATDVKFTNFATNNIGLMIQEGNEMNDAFGINSWPTGVVDRINARGAGMNSSLWASAVSAALEVPTDVHIAAEASVSDSVINVKTDIYSGSDRDCALQVWVVEDSIVTRQLTMQGRVDNYVHNNVLRDVHYSVSKGEPITLHKGISLSKESAIHTKWTDKERWNWTNLSIVAFVFQGTDILNAIRVPVTITGNKE